MYKVIKEGFKILYTGLFISMIILTSAVTVFAGDATLAWDPPTTNADGSPLTDLAGYKIYYVTTSGNYTNSITVTGHLRHLQQQYQYHTSSIAPEPISYSKA